MQLLTKALVAGLLAVSLAGCGAPAPTAPVPPFVATPADPLPLAELDAFSSVAMMNAGSNCSGTLVDTGVDSGPAYILTNGHCVGDVGRPAQQTTIDIEWPGTATFFVVEGNQANHLVVDTVRLEYSTMRHTDTAFVRLDATLGELKAKGVRPVAISQIEPSGGSKVVNVGVPVQDLDPADWMMRKGKCQLGQQRTLLEGGWLWFDVWSNDCPGIIQGSSGSPLFSVNDAGVPEKIVAMINTTSWGSAAANGGACTLNNPCELEGGRTRMVDKTSYAQSVAGMDACFDATGKFTLEGSCPLPRSNVWAELGGGSFQGGDTLNAFGQLPEVSLVGPSQSKVRTAVAPIGDGDVCQLPAIYRDSAAAVLPATSADGSLEGLKVSVDLPETEGHYALCAVNGNDYNQAATVLFDVDRTPPLFAANADVEDIGDGVMQVQPHIIPPQIATVRFTWGAPGKVDCENREAFQDFFIVPVTLEPKDLPATYCVYGMDAAGNQTPVTKIEIPKG